MAIIADSFVELNCDLELAKLISLTVILIFTYNYDHYFLSNIFMNKKEYMRFVYPGPGCLTNYNVLSTYLNLNFILSFFPPNSTP